MCGTLDDTDAYWDAELEELARTDGAQIIDERICPEDSQAYRAVCSVWEGRICYTVECAPLLKDGSVEDNWGTMGGSPGMHSSDFRTMEQTKIAWESLKALAGDEDAFWGWIDMSNRNFPALP